MNYPCTAQLRHAPSLLLAVLALAVIRPAFLSKQLAAATPPASQKAVTQPTDHGRSSPEAWLTKRKVGENRDQQKDLRLIEIASHGMKRVTAEFERSEIKINAQAALRDQRPNNVYVWALQIVDSNGAVGMFQIYDHQPFHLTPGESFTPTFDEAFHMDLPPGKYRARVFVFGVTENSCFDKVSGEQFAKQFFRKHSGCMGSDTFLVP